MAIDTETKRRSMLGRSLMFLVVAPVPDGTLSSVDRLHIIGFPGTIAPAAPVVTTTALNYFCDTGTVADTPPEHAADSGNNLLVADTLEVQQDLYAGGTSNYAKWIDGTLTLAGTARVLRDIRIGAGSWKLGSTAPTAAISGNFPTLTFANGQDDAAHYEIIVPHRRAAGTHIDIVVEWYYEGAQDNGAVEWNLTYLSVADGENPEAAGTNITKTSAGTHLTDLLVTTEFDQYIDSANIANGEPLGMKLWRDGTNDANGKNVKLIAVHLHFTMDKLGNVTV